MHLPSGKTFAFTGSRQVIVNFEDARIREFGASIGYATITLTAAAMTCATNAMFFDSP